MPEPIVDIYRERPSLSQMRQRICDGEIQSVVVTTIYRLSRSQVHLTFLMEEMGQYNVKLHGASEVNGK